MKRWTRWGSVTLTLVVSVSFLAGDASAYTMRSPEGGFSVEFNAKPAFRMQDEVDADGDKLKVFLWELSEAGEKVFLVTYNAIKAGEIAQVGLAEAYKTVMQASLQGSGSRQISADPIDHSGISGWEMIASTPVASQTFTMRQWTFIKGDRLFQIMYLGNPGTEKEPAVQKFLESVKID